MTRVQAALLDALSAGPVTGAELAGRLDVAPGDVRAHVEDLRAAGFEIDEDETGYRVVSVPGYGLGVAYDLDAPFEVEFHESIGSTNDRGRELARDGAADVVVLAGQQTGGRGRHERSWSSPTGGVYLSLVLRPDIAPDRLHLLTLATAVAVARAARAMGVEAVIKWPNDVLVTSDGGKIAGILTETETRGGETAWAVIGAGVNADVDAGDLPEGSTSLRRHADGVDRRAFVQGVLEAFDDLRRDPDGILEAWRLLADTLGREVRISTPGGTVVGTALDVDATGALLVDDGEDVVRITDGRCEHLRPA